MVPSSQNMYSDDDDSRSPAAADDSHETHSQDQTALVPKAIFGGDVKPGDECRIKAVSVHGDEVAVERCDYNEDDGGDDSTPESKTRPDSPGGLSSMLED